MPDYTSWDESKGRIEDRFENLEARLEKVLGVISRNVERLVWLILTAILGLAGHALVSYLQVAAKH